MNVLKRSIKGFLLITNHLVASVIEDEVLNFDTFSTHRTIRVSLVAEEVKDSKIAITPLDNNITLPVSMAAGVLATGFGKE